jgi:hypothetical protein
MSSMYAVETVTAPVVEHFNPKINAWAEGTVMSVDADGAKFTIRGTKRAYASTYAKMLKEVYEKTAGLSPDLVAAKSDEIRATWREKLLKAGQEEAGKSTDYTFRLPAKDARLAFFDETQLYDRKAEPVQPAPGVKLTERERKALMALKDLKVGESVVVGYDGGVVFNDAYVVIKVSPSDKKVSGAN